VWVKKDNLGIDVRGAYPEPFVAALANGGAGAEIYDLSADEVRAEVVKKEYPDGVKSELVALAQQIFDSHERFAVAWPPKVHVVSLFEKWEKITNDRE